MVVVITKLSNPVPLNILQELCSICLMHITDSYIASKKANGSYMFWFGDQEISPWLKHLPCQRKVAGSISGATCKNQAQYWQLHSLRYPAPQVISRCTEAMCASHTMQDSTHYKHHSYTDLVSSEWNLWQANVWAPPTNEWDPWWDVGKCIMASM